MNEMFDEVGKKIARKKVKKNVQMPKLNIVLEKGEFELGNPMKRTKIWIIFSSN